MLYFEVLSPGPPHCPVSNILLNTTCRTLTARNPSKFRGLMQDRIVPHCSLDLELKDFVLVRVSLPTLRALSSCPPSFGTVLWSSWLWFLWACVCTWGSHKKVMGFCPFLSQQNRKENKKKLAWVWNWIEEVQLSRRLAFSYIYDEFFNADLHYLTRIFFL